MSSIRRAWSVLWAALSRGHRARWVGGVLVVAGGLVAARWLTADRGEAVETARVQRQDLVLSVVVEGELAAVRSIDLGPPARTGVESGEYKISFLAPESAAVKPGEQVLGFDAQPLTKSLEEKTTELAEVAKKIEQKRVDVQVKLLGIQQRLAEAEANLRKARLKADVPPELVARIEAEQLHLDVTIQERELASLEAERHAVQAAANAELELLTSQRARAQGRLDALKGAIEAMTVRAPQAGIVIYKTGWNDEKRKVGDSVWVMEKVISLPDLSEMQAFGDVDETDAALVAAGQKVTFRLEARPDLDFSGRIRTIGRGVRRKSWRVPVKVYRVEIALDRTDPQVMRPAMRFRGEIETGRIPGVVSAPREAVFLRPAGPVVWVKGRWGFREQAVKLGRSNRRLVEVVAGVSAGAELALADLIQDRVAGSRGPRREGR